MILDSSPLASLVLPLAPLVLIIGTAAVIVLLYLLIRFIFLRKR